MRPLSKGSFLGPQLALRVQRGTLKARAFPSSWGPAGLSASFQMRFLIQLKYLGSTPSHEQIQSVATEGQSQSSSSCLRLDGVWGQGAVWCCEAGERLGRPTALSPALGRFGGDCPGAQEGMHMVH